PDSWLSAVRGTSPLRPPAASRDGRTRLSPGVDRFATCRYGDRRLSAVPGVAPPHEKTRFGGASGFRGAGAPKIRRLGELGAVVELLDVHGSGRGGFDAELAEDALIEVLLDDLDSRGAGLEDVDRADLFQLRR